MNSCTGGDDVIYVPLWVMGVSMFIEFAIMYYFATISYKGGFEDGQKNYIPDNPSGNKNIKNLE